MRIRRTDTGQVSVTDESHGPAVTFARLGRPVLARRGHRVMRLTARGRRVLLGLILTIGLLIGWFAEDLGLISWWR